MLLNVEQEQVWDVANQVSVHQEQWKSLLENLELTWLKSQKLVEILLTGPVLFGGLGKAGTGSMEVQGKLPEALRQNGKKFLLRRAVLQCLYHGTHLGIALEEFQCAGLGCDLSLMIQEVQHRLHGTHHVTLRSQKHVTA